jgi:hypothetical protein
LHTPSARGGNAMALPTAKDVMRELLEAGPEVVAFRMHAGRADSRRVAVNVIAIGQTPGACR